jgi:lipoprotein-anchoring transpeptidase ErfK/SrfK
MATITTKFFRGTVLALMIGVVPVASATGQDQVQGTDPQALIHAAAAQQPVGQPASMSAPVAPAASGPMAMTQHVVEAAAAEVREAEAAAEAIAAFESEAAALRPGQFIWRPELAPTGQVEMVVSLERQMAYVYRANTLIGVTTVSTGRRGHRTPTGSFPILQKNRRHFSNLYNNAPMPNMQRLTWDGIALHAGALPGYPASHGCVRLPMEFSRLLFDATRMGDRVHIVDDAPPSAHEALQFATGRAPANAPAIRLASLRR